MEKPSLDQLRIERRPEKESSSWRWPVIMILAAIIAAAAWFFWSNRAVSVEVRTAAVREFKSQAAGTVLNASGYVTARRQATVSSKFTGKVMEVLIEEGMTVEAGQVLARLDDSNITASFELGKAQLVSAQKGLKETETLLNEAQINYERSRNLVEKKLASEAELDRNRALAGSLAAQLERKRADVEVAARQLDIYQRQIEDTVIRAPFAGVIVAKNAQPGEMISPVSAGGGFTRTGIGTIVDMSSLEIEIDVNEAYINRVKPGQEVVATLDAYPDWKIPAHVITIIPTADRQRATVEVRVGFDELDSRVLPDMGVKVAFQESAQSDDQPAQRKSGVLVPKSAVRRHEGRDYVLVVNDGQLERRAVAVSENRGSDILLSSGVVAGEAVVVEGPADLTDGMRVREMRK
jgi:RND family efflux transporter MFP subunit